MIMEAEAAMPHDKKFNDLFSSDSEEIAVPAPEVDNNHRKITQSQTRDNNLHRRGHGHPPPPAPLAKPVSEAPLPPRRRSRSRSRSPVRSDRRQHSRRDRRRSRSPKRRPSIVSHSYGHRRGDGRGEGRPSASFVSQSTAASLAALGKSRPTMQ